MEHKREVLVKESTDNDIIGRLVLSTDILGIMKDDNTVERLLDGKDNTGYVLEGPINDLYIVIDACYEARFNNKPIKFVLKLSTITFK